MSNEELRQKYNPDGSELRQMQMRMLEMLLCFDRICKKHNIRYWLCSGTLLGAIRHEGFIPWDDDLDVEVMRDDYKKLMKILPSELPENYVLQNHDTDPGYFFCFAKLRDKNSYLEETNRYDRIFTYKGIFIDIFPYEPVPKWIHWLSCQTFGHIYSIMNNPEYNNQLALRKVNKIYDLNHKFIFPLLRGIGALIPVKLWHYGLGIPYNNDCYVDEIFPLKTAKFEGYDMPVPNDCHSWLTRKFGDYMKLPNLDDIQSHTCTMKIYNNDKE